MFPKKKYFNIKFKDNLQRYYLVANVIKQR